MLNEILLLFALIHSRQHYFCCAGYNPGGFGLRFAVYGSADSSGISLAFAQLTEFFYLCGDLRYLSPSNRCERATTMIKPSGVVVLSSLSEGEKMPCFQARHNRGEAQ